MCRVVGWTENPTGDEIKSVEKSHMHCRVSDARRVCINGLKIPRSDLGRLVGEKNGSTLVPDNCKTDRTEPIGFIA
jgi:hypothetical protein